jgi:hypothetical protein
MTKVEVILKLIRSFGKEIGESRMNGFQKKLCPFEGVPSNPLPKHFPIPKYQIFAFSRRLPVPFVL